MCLKGFTGHRGGQPAGSLSLEGSGKSGRTTCTGTIPRLPGADAPNAEGVDPGLRPQWRRHAVEQNYDHQTYEDLYGNRGTFAKPAHVLIASRFQR